MYIVYSENAHTFNEKKSNFLTRLKIISSYNSKLNAFTYFNK